MEFRKNALAAYVHCRRTFDQITDKGWRRAYCWSGIVVALFSHVYAPAHHIQVDVGAANGYLALVFGAFVTRGVEKVMAGPVTDWLRARGVPVPPSPTGGLVNNEALQ